MVFLVQLDEFEGGTSAIALFFGEFIPLVDSTLAVLWIALATEGDLAYGLEDYLLLDCHDGSLRTSWLGREQRFVHRQRCELSAREDIFEIIKAFGNMNFLRKLDAVYLVLNKYDLI